MWRSPFHKPRGMPPRYEACPREVALLRSCKLEEWRPQTRKSFESSELEIFFFNISKSSNAKKEGEAANSKLKTVAVNSS